MRKKTYSIASITGPTTPSWSWNSQTHMWDLMAHYGYHVPSFISTLLPLDFHYELKDFRNLFFNQFAKMIKIQHLPVSLLKQLIGIEENVNILGELQQKPFHYWRM